MHYVDRMIRFLWRTVVFLASAAIGLVVASLVLDDFHISTRGFIITVVIFAVLQSILQPFLLKVALKNATAFTGGIGLVSTFVALLITSWVGDSLRIDGVVTWILATLIVWLVTAVATLLVPFVLVRSGVESLRERRG